VLVKALALDQRLGHPRAPPYKSRCKSWSPNSTWKGYAALCERYGLA